MIEMIFPVFSKNLEWMSTDCGYTLQNVISTDVKRQMSLLNVHNTQLASSMLLQAAVSYNDKGCLVVYIATEPWHQLPKLVHGMPTPDPVLMNRVHMLYMDQCEQLVNYLSDIHRQFEAIPDVIIVQNLDWFISQSPAGECQHHAMAHLCSLLCDTSQYIANRNSVCHVIVSMADIDNTFIPICSRFLDDIWTLQLKTSSESKELFELVCHQLKYKIPQQEECTDLCCDIVVEFTVTDQLLCLYRLVQRLTS
jgi:hypothetical protein